MSLKCLRNCVLLLCALAIGNNCVADNHHKYTTWRGDVVEVKDARRLSASEVDGAVGIWRITNPRLHATGKFSLVQDHGQLHKAVVGTENRYFFSEKGAGTLDIAILGRPDEVLLQLAYERSKGRKVVNSIKELPDIYVGLSKITVKSSFEVFDPIGDAMSNIATFFLNDVAPSDFAGTLYDAATGISEVVNQAITKASETRLLKGTKTKPGVYSDDTVMLKISYMPSKGLQKMATGELTFDRLLKEYQDSLLRAAQNNKSKKTAGKR